MQAETTVIADKVRGVAREKRVTQERIGDILGLSRQAVNQRFAGRVPFTGSELFVLSLTLEVGVLRFFPDPSQFASHPDSGEHRPRDVVDGQ